ncbi:MAG: hypothetical protein ACFE9S_02845 [Candidatus Hermodarchaeota archaeon]
MDSIEKKFVDVKTSNNSEKLNDFLIELSKNPQKEYLKYLGFFSKNLESQVFEKIQLNFIYLIGEIGRLVPLEEGYLSLLIDTYYKSDRWIRSEIIQAIKKIIEKNELTEEIIKLIGYAINDEYRPIKINSLKIILNLKEIPIFIRRSIFLALKTNDIELNELCIRIFEKHIPDFNDLFNSLDYSDNYILLKPHAIRTLLLTYFKSPINIESFRTKILESNWKIEYKEGYIKEIDVYTKILLKSI